MSASIRPMTTEDVAAVAACARPADVDEIKACCGLDIDEALSHCISHSLRAWIIESDGKPLAAVGDTLAAFDVGVPWMITTSHIVDCRRGFLRASRAIMAEMFQRHHLLINYVDARNTDAIRWLLWLGVTMEQPAPYGVAGLPFRKFTKNREV